MKTFQNHIDATHPMNENAPIGALEADALAMKLVGERHAKRDLANLVRWLILRNPVKKEMMKANMVPIAYKLPLTRFVNGPSWQQMEVVATNFSNDGLSPIAWAVREGSSVLSKEGEWEYEPIPSSRDDDFIARTRWATALEAAEAAEQWFNHERK